MSFLSRIMELFGHCQHHEDDGYAVIVVKDGDNLWNLVKNITECDDDDEIQTYVNQVVALNPEITNPDVIHPGQNLKIPASWVKDD